MDIYITDGQTFTLSQTISVVAPSGLAVLKINGHLYMAVASQRAAATDTSSTDTFSFIYVLDNSNGVMQLLQSVPTQYATSVLAFETPDSAAGFVFTNLQTATAPAYYTVGSAVYLLNSQSGQFALSQTISTSGARDVDSFVSDNILYLVFAEFAERTVSVPLNYDINSRLYQWVPALGQFAVVSSAAIQTKVC